MRLRINCAGISLALEAETADDLEAAYTMLLAQPSQLKELLDVLVDDDDSDEDDDTTDDPGEDGPDGGATADVDKLLAGIFTR